MVAFASNEQLTIGAASAARPPNIVYFVTDDQDQMLGGSFPTTAPGMATPLPKVKELMVEGGATFENMFIHVPICNPSRSTTLTGRYFHNIKSSMVERGGGGGRHDSGGGDPRGNGQLEDDTMHVNMSRVHNRSFAVRLQRRGYTLGLFGKYLNAMPGNVGNTTAPGGYVPTGWSAWLANGGGSYIAPQFATHGLMAAAGIADGAIHLSNAPANYSTSVIGNVSMAWIRHTVATEPHRPFFAYIAPKAAHEPFDPAPWYADAWDAGWPEHEPRPVNWNCTAAARSAHAGVVPSQPMISQG